MRSLRYALFFLVIAVFIFFFFFGSFFSYRKEFTGVIDGVFTGTEMACEFSDIARVGDEMICNTGFLALMLRTDDGDLYTLEGHTCEVYERLVKVAEDSVSSAYIPLSCTGDFRYQEFVTLVGDLKDARSISQAIRK